MAENGADEAKVESGATGLEPDAESMEAGVGAFGMKIFLGSLTMIFLATIMGYLMTWSRAETWPPAGAPPLPKGLWLSTIVILMTSVTVQSALGSARKGAAGALKGWLAATLALGLLFLVLQGMNWSVLIAQQFTMKKDLYAFLFYLLTGLHAAHVIGGLVPLAVVTRKALRGGYSSASHAGVKYSAMYWHFLDVIWVVLFAVLLATR